MTILGGNHIYTFSLLKNNKSEENLNAVKSNIRSRLGSKTSARNSENVEAMDSAIYDEDKVLDRNELERLRFANAFSSGSWDSNPENVPRGNYFEVCGKFTIVTKIHLIQTYA